MPKDSQFPLIQETGQSVIVDDQRIEKIITVSKPSEIRKELDGNQYYPLINEHRKNIAKILHSENDRLLVLVGPCSIHNSEEGLEYAHKLAQLAKQYEEDLLVVMRIYFEKPRTIIGWKGLINDPNLDNTFDVNLGIRLARKFLLDIAAMGLPAGTEVLDLLSPQYIMDLVSWGCIGARTAESQLHRELASGLSCPVGFKNTTEGNVEHAINAMISSSHKHVFLSSSKDGHIGLFHSRGNRDSHIVLRGGSDGPNYSIDNIEQTVSAIQAKRVDVSSRVLVDVSHANSNKNHNNQPLVIDYLSEQIANGCDDILGVMMESNLNEGNQPMAKKEELLHGVSITDACISFAQTTKCLDQLATASHSRIKAK